MDDNQKTFLKLRDSHNKGQYTEKRIHLSSRLPYWLQAVTPRVFYVIEKSWNFYPYTITGKIQTEVLKMKFLFFFNFPHAIKIRIYGELTRRFHMSITN